MQPESKGAFLFLTYVSLVLKPTEEEEYLCSQCKTRQDNFPASTTPTL